MIARSKLQGYAMLVKRLEGVKGRIPTVMKEGLRQCAEKVLERALVYTPVSTPEEAKFYPGYLRDSARIEEYGTGHKFRAVFTIAYYAPYAVYVHEVLEYAHEPPTSAKFLERAAREVAPECVGIVAEGFKTETRAF